MDARKLVSWRRIERTVVVLGVLAVGVGVGSWVRYGDTNPFVDPWIVFGGYLVTGGAFLLLLALISYWTRTSPRFPWGPERNEGQVLPEHDP